MEPRKVYVKPSIRDATPAEAARFRELVDPFAGVDEPDAEIEALFEGGGRDEPIDERCGECDAPVVRIKDDRIETHEATCSQQMPKVCPSCKKLLPTVNHPSLGKLTELCPVCCAEFR